MEKCEKRMVKIVWNVMAVEVLVAVFSVCNQLAYWLSARCKECRDVGHSCTREHPVRAHGEDCSPR